MNMSFLVNALFFDLKWASSLPTFFVPWYGNEFESGRFYPAARPLNTEKTNVLIIWTWSTLNWTASHIAQLCIFIIRSIFASVFLHEIADSPFIGLQLVRRQEIKWRTDVRNIPHLIEVIEWKTISTVNSNWIRKK